MAGHISSSEKRKAHEMLDRISNLPEEVVDKILMAMPIRDAVKTSLLSRPWRYKWASMPDLVFDTRSRSTLHVPEASGKLVNFVTKVLLLHCSSVISKFELNNFLEHGCLDVDHWILTLSRKSLNHLVLQFSPSANPYRVPLCLFACKALRNLKLRFCTLNLPSDYIGLTYITTLTLHFVSVTNEAFERLVLQMPNLQQLMIGYCVPLSNFHMDAPNLKTLRIAGACDILCIRNSPRLKHVGLHKCLPGSGYIHLEKVLRELNVVEAICIYHPFVESSWIDITSARSGATYEHLRHARLHINFEDSKQILALLFLCESSPLLSTLYIKAKWDRHSALLFEECFWKAEVKEQRTVLTELKSVKLLGFKGVEHDMGFAQYILLNSNTLEKFCISWKEKTSMNEELDAVNNMMQFQRASSKAKVHLRR